LDKPNFRSLHEETTNGGKRYITNSSTYELTGHPLNLYLRYYYLYPVSLPITYLLCKSWMKVNSLERFKLRLINSISVAMEMICKDLQHRSKSYCPSSASFIFLDSLRIYHNANSKVPGKCTFTGYYWHAFYWVSLVNARLRYSFSLKQTHIPLLPRAEP